jgi:hypothetical protein
VICGNKLSYNPYIAKWNTEEGYETVKESIEKGIVTEEYVYRPVGVSTDVRQ